MLAAISLGPIALFFGLLGLLIALCKRNSDVLLAPYYLAKHIWVKCCKPKKQQTPVQMVKNGEVMYPAVAGNQMRPVQVIIIPQPVQTQLMPTAVDIPVM